MYEAAKMKEEDSLTSLYDNLITAQISYLNAIDSYNAAVLSVNQELEGYQLTIQSAVAGSNDSVNQLKLADLQKQLSDCTITAPMDGIVSKLPAEEGSYVQAAGSVATVTDYSQMKIAVKIGEYDILGVNEGDSVIVSIDALESTYDGTIKKIARDATVQGGVSYFEAEVEIEADEVVRSGMSAEVKLIIEDVKQVVSVPSAAVVADSNGEYFVYVKDPADPKNTTPVQIPVTIGVTDGSYTQITQGLSEGDDILVPKTDSMALLMQEMSDRRDGASSSDGGANE
jgi:RND family efflux transporter MFP subunit